VEPSIAPSTIIDIKTTGVRWFFAPKVAPLVSVMPAFPTTPMIAHQNLSITDYQRMHRLRQLGFNGGRRISPATSEAFDRLGHKHAPRSNSLGATALNLSQLWKRQRLIQTVNLIKTLLCCMNNRSLYFVPTAKIRRI
jgi:hypothetical protein